jgi:hypothetical protein
MLTIGFAHARRLSQQLDAIREFVGKEIGCRRTIAHPPLMNFSNLFFGDRGGENRQAHRRLRSSSTIAEAGRISTLSADSSDRVRA